MLPIVLYICLVNQSVNRFFLQTTIKITLNYMDYDEERN
jgi:hypothetical protein